ncbi:MAG TPA: hypothetical protein VFN68_08955 [Acidimicrobiales bacterium]|nr:hypothetical protein [Acidimicrobiales bacterium]
MAVGLLTALVVGLTVAVALLGVLVAGLLRGHADVLRALHQLGVDLDPSAPSARPAGPVSVASPGVRPTPARPDAADVIDLTGLTPAGDAISLAVGGVRHDTLVAFLTSGCATCRAFWDAFRTGMLEVPGGARLVVVTRGGEAESPGTIAGLAGPTPVVMSTEAWEHYDIPYAPYFVYVSGPASRVVGEGVAAGWEEVRALVANAVADGTTAPGGTRRGLHERSRADQMRDDAVDRALQDAGIEPGDPRLYPTSISDGAGG